MGGVWVCVAGSLQCASAPQLRRTTYCRDRAANTQPPSCPIWFHHGLYQLSRSAVGLEVNWGDEEHSPQPQPPSPDTIHVRHSSHFSTPFIPWTKSLNKKTLNSFTQFCLLVLLGYVICCAFVGLHYKWDSNLVFSHRFKKKILYWLIIRNLSRSKWKSYHSLCKSSLLFALSCLAVHGEPMRIQTNKKTNIPKKAWRLIKQKSDFIQWHI